MMLLEKTQRWNDMIWLACSSSTCPSNIGMSEDSLVSMVGQARSWDIESLINLIRSNKLRISMYGKCGSGRGSCTMVVLLG